MTISARIDTDSINESGDRITTWILRYPRFIHADFMTHRMFSRNGSSSRARRATNILKEVVLDPVVPIEWGKNGKGMSADKTLSSFKSWLCKKIWLSTRLPVVASVWLLNKIGLHKQWTNRLLEPWAHITVIMTATEMDNFFALRDSDKAQPEIHELASQMKREYNNSIPVLCMKGEWHIPLLTQAERDRLTSVNLRSRGFFLPDNTGEDLKWLSETMRVSTARAARVSYNRTEMIKSKEEDLDLHDKLKSDGHWSPFEHCASAEPGVEWVGNFYGWAQYRKSFMNESGSDRNS